MKSKKKLVLFTANKNECINHFPNTIIVGTIMTYNSKDENDTCPSMSGVVILMMNTIRDNKDESLWTNNTQTIALRYKTNSLETYSRHGTSGFTYSFGNRPFYGNNNGSTVSCYNMKTSKVLIRNTLIQ